VTNGQCLPPGRKAKWLRFRNVYGFPESVQSCRYYNGALSALLLPKSKNGKLP
jgi:hypothetical protein